MTTHDENWMNHAVQIARQGQGFVEPNPMVGCVLVKNGQAIGEGWHEKFGGPHAEVHAIESATNAGINTHDATAYVTLEPCSHHGKTGPCSAALIDAKVARVVVAHPDPNPQVGGQGMAALIDAGIKVDVGICRSASAQLLAPYLKIMRTKLPWTIAKWAMTLDGKIATSTGDSQWISNSDSRQIVHKIRGRVDAIMVGVGTAIADNPTLNARPAGARVATRVVVDSTARLSPNSTLCKTAGEIPTLIAVGPAADATGVALLRATGCEVWIGTDSDPNGRLLELMAELGRQGMTNVLVEGGGRLLGSLNDLKQIDEVHLFLGPKIVGGPGISPICGLGHEVLANSTQLKIQSLQQIGDDIYAVFRADSN